MTFLDAPLPRERLDLELRIVAANLTWLAARYPVMPMGRSSLVIPRPEVHITEDKEEKAFSLVTGSGRFGRIPYRRAVGGNQLSRTRLRAPGLTAATSKQASALAEEAPWALQSGISLAADEMTTWVLMNRLKGHETAWNEATGELTAGRQVRTLSSFQGGTLGTHCYPTEGHFVRDVCGYLNPWFSAETETDGDLDGDEVRIDAILTHKDTGFRLGVEFKHPHTLGGSILHGLRQASSYRFAEWEGHGRLPVALCCPGRVPTGKETEYVKRRLGVGLLDLAEDGWSVDHNDFTWQENHL